MTRGMKAMRLRRVLSGCGVVALSFGVGGMAYSQTTSAPASGSSSATGQHGAVSLSQMYAQIAALASHPQSADAAGASLPAQQAAAGGEPVHFYNAGGQGYLSTPENAHSAEEGLVGDRQLPAGGEQSTVTRKKSYACSAPGDTCSTNWSGLEDWGQQFTGVSGDWTVPTSNPTQGPNDTGTYKPEDMSTWIGVDGDPTFQDSDDPSLIQVGTDSPSQTGTTDGYETWYELLPGFEIPLFLVHPGDQIEAVITETAQSPDIWEVAIEDVTTGVAWSDSGITYDSPGDTAEWVQEATTLCTGPDACAISQFQDFGSVTFTDMGYTAGGGRGHHRRRGRHILPFYLCRRRQRRHPRLPGTEQPPRR
jgi:hypothetical protein